MKTMKNGMLSMTPVATTLLLTNGKTKETLHKRPNQNLKKNLTAMKLPMATYRMINNLKIKMITEIKLSTIMDLLINGKEKVTLHKYLIKGKFSSSNNNIKTNSVS